MLIVKRYDKELVSLVSYRCGDTEYNDFSEKEYGQAILRAQNKVATEFSVIVKQITFVYQTGDPTWLVIPATEMKGVSRISVNAVDYKHSANATEENTYDYRYDSDKKWRFTYYNMQANDEIILQYSTAGEVASTQDGAPILSHKYNDRIIDLAVKDIAMIGITKPDEATRQKYANLYKLYGNEKYDGNLERNDAWTIVKPFIYP